MLYKHEHCHQSIQPLDPYAVIGTWREGFFWGETFTLNELGTNVETNKLIFPAAVTACKAIFGHTAGFRERTVDRSGFSAKGESSFLRPQFPVGGGGGGGTENAYFDY